MNFFSESKKTVHMMGTTITLTIIHQTPDKIIDRNRLPLKVYEQRFNTEIILAQS